MLIHATYAFATDLTDTAAANAPAPGWFADQPTPIEADPKDIPAAAAVANMFYGVQRAGSGSLYLSPRLVITAAHITYFNDGAPIPDLSATFPCADDQPQTLDGHIIARGKARESPNDQPVDWQDDWALLVLKHPVPPRCARPFEEFSGTIVDAMQMNGSFSLIGYPNIFKAGRVVALARNCRILGMSGREGFIKHCCGSSRGDSGGPLLVASGDGWYRVVATDSVGVVTHHGAPVCAGVNSNGAVFASVWRVKAARVAALLDDPRHLTVEQIEDAMRSSE